MMEVADILRETEDKMRRTLEVFHRELAGIRAGRANPALLHQVHVDYFGTPTPVNQLANITVPEPRMLVIQPWDRNLVSAIEKAIMKSDLGINPTSDGTVIRLVLPQPTEERRRELVKSVHRKAEEEKVALRNLRRDGVEQLRAKEKDHSLSEDAFRRAQEEVQKLTDRYTKEIDEACAAKEKEIREV